MMEIAPKILDFLHKNNTTKIAHSGATLFEHLLGVHRILKKAGLPDEVRHAGLFHSIYGKKSFKHQTLCQKRRELVKKLIGEYAEELTWIFSTLHRPEVFELFLKKKCTKLLKEINNSHPKK